MLGDGTDAATGRMGRALLGGARAAPAWARGRVRDRRSGRRKRGVDSRAAAGAAGRIWPGGAHGAEGALAPGGGPSLAPTALAAPAGDRLTVVQNSDGHPPATLLLTRHHNRRTMQ